MHIVIYALVEASAHDDALATGKTVFDRLVGADPHAGAVFDYHVTFDEEDTTVAGKARWGELPTAAPVDSDDGQDLLERGWEATKEEFERNLERVKEAIDELSDEEIVRDEDLARHAFHQVGAYDGPTIFLYNEYANAIRHREQLDRVLEESEELWICLPMSTSEYEPTLTRLRLVDLVPPLGGNDPRNNDYPYHSLPCIDG